MAPSPKSKQITSNKVGQDKADMVKVKADMAKVKVRADMAKVKVKVKVLVAHGRNHK